METVFDVISDDFLSDLDAISDLIGLVANGGGSSKSRVASINSATLLLAATFEELIREMGRQFAREIVSRTENVADLPRKLIATAWRRGLEDMARAKIDTGGTSTPLLHIATDARSEFDAICKFLEGDRSQNIYKHIAHNDNNMRPDQINTIFKICDLNNICSKISETEFLKHHLAEDDGARAHSKFLTALNDFMEKRNGIAHSLNPGNSASAEQFLEDVNLLRSVSLAMAACLPSHLP
ncbi:HEPN domain-containing protein [uncultured Bradyrhizobium sp.]|uniref:HEPN domain-containing protein n=1 Tax=unclassified Sphingomonas TaxID=196159 RepID=UPI002635FDDC|nr:HEPN domain-containing protein [uncultured Bradyrhizobium sp.]